MANATRGTGYRLYWITWICLLAITTLMLALEYVSWPAWILLAVLLAAMLVKASVIAGYFMHLRFERPVLILIVAASVLFFGAYLFALLAVDAHRIHEISVR